MKVRTITQTFSTVALALAVVALAAPGALAEPKKITVPAELSHIQHPGGVSDFDTYDFVQPTGVYDVVRYPMSPSATAGGFAWRDAAIGGGFAIGLCLFAAGGVLAGRKQSPGAQHS